MSAKKSSRSRASSGGRVTPKGVRPPGVTAHESKGTERPSSGLGHHAGDRGQRAPARPQVVRQPMVRQGHRGV